MIYRTLCLELAAFRDGLLVIVSLETTAESDFQEKEDKSTDPYSIFTNIQRFNMCILLTVSSVNCFSNLQDVESNERTSREIANLLAHRRPVNLLDGNEEPAPFRKAAIFAFTIITDLR